MSEEPIELYEFYLQPRTDGWGPSWELGVRKYLVVHETPCYYFCISSWNYSFDKEKTWEEIKAAKYIKVYKIHKTRSHKAFTDKQKALNNFIYRKRKHLQHLERTKTMVSSFLNVADQHDGDLAKLIEACPKRIFDDQWHQLKI